jgi:glycosyltransferase involved in cell wall biosynthesis
MKVMQIMAGAPHGGAETFYADLVVALHQSGLEQVAVTRTGTDRAERLRAAGVPVVGYPSALFPGWGRMALGGLIRRHKPDVVQVWQGRAASHLPHTAVPAIGWFGGYYDLARYGNCNQFVAVTRDIRRHVIESGCPKDRAHTIHTFALLDEAQPVKRAAEGTPEGVALILVLARLHEKKGIDTLLQALSLTHGTFLWIAGDGELRADLEKLAGKLRVADRVRFLGWRTDRAALLRSCDLLALPSRYEPFGTVMVEAWQTGVPLIACAAAGPSAYVQDGRNGLLVPIDDASALALAIRRAVEDKALRTALVEGGRASYEADFTKEKIVAAYRDLYEKAAAGRR